MAIELGPKSPGPARAIGPIATGVDASAQPGSLPARVAVATGEPVAWRSTAPGPGEPPVDAERVTEIRRAIERGTYPIVPARVADAMIAAGLLLRHGQ